MGNTGNRIVSAIADDENLVTYRPALRRIAGSVTSVILFQQILHYAKCNGWKPFYKFALPCDHQLCRPGDSWTERLGFTEHEFEGARSRFATKIGVGESKVEAAKTCLVFYWTDAARVTWYEVNIPLVEALVAELYSDSNEPKGEIRLYKERRKSAFTDGGNPPLHSSESTESTEVVEISGSPSEISTTPPFPSEPSAPGDPPAQEPEESPVADDADIVYGRGHGKGVRCTCDARTRIEYRRNLERTPCCGRKIVWEVAPRTPAAVYLASAHEFWYGFSTVREQREWEALENRFGLIVFKKAIDWAVDTKKIGARFVAKSVMTAVSGSVSGSRLFDTGARMRQKPERVATGAVINATTVRDNTGMVRE